MKSHIAARNKNLSDNYKHRKGRPTKSEPVLEKFGTGKKYRNRYRKNLVSEKVRESVSKKFGTEKVPEPVSENFGTEKKSRNWNRSDFGSRHTLLFTPFSFFKR